MGKFKQGLLILEIFGTRHYENPLAVKHEKHVILTSVFSVESKACEKVRNICGLGR